MGHSIELAFDPTMVFKIIVRSFSGFHTLENLVESRKYRPYRQMHWKLWSRYTHVPKNVGYLKGDSLPVQQWPPNGCSYWKNTENWDLWPLEAVHLVLRGHCLPSPQAERQSPRASSFHNHLFRGTEGRPPPKWNWFLQHLLYMSLTGTKIHGRVGESQWSECSWV